MRDALTLLVRVGHPSLRGAATHDQVTQWRRGNDGHETTMGGPRPGPRDGRRRRRASLAQSPQPGAPGEVVKLGFVTKFPVDFFFTLENAAKAWDEAHPEAEVLFAQGQSATDDAGADRGHRGPRGAGRPGHRHHAHERRGHPGARQGHRGRRQGRAHGQRPARLDRQDRGRRDRQPRRRRARRRVAGRACCRPGDTLADPRGRARGARARRARRRHAPGPGRPRRRRSRSSSSCRPAAPRTRARPRPRTSSPATRT